MAANVLRRATGTLAIPLLVFVVLTLLCTINGVSLFGSGDSFLLLTRGTATTMLTATALAVNLNSGRFDFSIGSIATLSSAIGATIALDAGGGFVTMAAVGLVAGLVLGAVSGLAYVVLRVSPMVCSLGIALLYEGIAFTISGGASVNFILDSGLTAFARSPLNMLIVMLVALALAFVVFDRSRFGFDYRALITGQAASVAAGMKEKRNAVGTYAFSGLLMSAVGLIIGSQMGNIETGGLNFASIGIMFTAFLPMFIGGYVGRFTNDKLGYLLGALCTTMIGLSFAALNLSVAQQSIINGLLLVVFLMFLSNEDLLKRGWRRLTQRQVRPELTGATS